LTYGAQAGCELFVSGVFKVRLDGNSAVGCDWLGPTIFPVTFLVPTLDCLGPIKSYKRSFKL